MPVTDLTSENQAIDVIFRPNPGDSIFSDYYGDEAEKSRRGSKRSEKLLQAFPITQISKEDYTDFSKIDSANP